MADGQALPPFDAIVLTGGAARRLGGRAKPALEVGGLPMATRVAQAACDAQRLIVVGPAPAGLAPDVLTREDPPGGGPVAALHAGLSHVDADVFALLAGDLPFLTPQTLDRLRAVGRDADVALLVDAEGRDQLLCSVWRAAAARDAIAGLGAGSAMRAVLRAVEPSRVRRCESHETGAAPAWFDCDTEEDLARARAWASRESGNAADRQR